MRRIWSVAMLVVLTMLGALAVPAFAQEGETQAGPASLTLFTLYPSQSVEIGESVTFDLNLRLSGSSPQVVDLSMAEIPEGWTATFTGGGRVVQSVYVQPAESTSEENRNATVSVRLEPPQDVAPGTYNFEVLAQGGGLRSELPLKLVVQERLPSRLTFDVELPTLKGSPTTTFRYDATLKNEGDEELTVNVDASAPPGFQVKFRLSSQEVTSFPMGPGETKNLDIEVVPAPQTPAGQYEITVVAQSSEVQEQVQLVADVTGQSNLSLTTPDERLSGQVYAGQSTPFTFVVQNTGSAPAQNVKMSSSQPSGWSITFSPEEISEVPAGGQVEVTANIQPAEQAIAGDYMVTVRAQPEGGTTESVELRLTVMTSTMWGIVGVALIAVAVGVVGIAVVRFGRR